MGRGSKHSWVSFSLRTLLYVTVPPDGRVTYFPVVRMSTALSAAPAVVAARASFFRAARIAFALSPLIAVHLAPYLRFRSSNSRGGMC